MALAEGLESAPYEDEWDEWHPPPTMYAYCVFRISNSDHLPSQPEVWYLVLMLLCQVTLVFSFSISESLDAFNKHVLNNLNRDRDDLACKYWPIVFHDRPLIFIVSVACTTVVVLGYVRIKDRDIMMTFHPEPRSIWAKYLINYAWFVQAIWLPSMFCGVTANLLWASEELMMNSVSLSYLLELDSYMFSAFISNKKKELYREEALMMNSHANLTDIQRAERVLYLTGLAQCAFISLMLHLLNRFQLQADTYAWGLWCSSLIYMLVYGLRALHVRVLRPSSDEDMTSITSRTSLSFMTSSFLGLSHYIALTLMWAPLTIFPPLFFERQSYCAPSFN